MAVPNSVSSLPIPQPRSPPKYPDLYGTHRKEAELQRMNREIGFLQEELLSVEGMQSASRCCKEVDDFVGLNPDPLIPLNQKPHRSFRIWKWLRAMSCFSLSWICCCSSGCSLHLKRSRCCSCDWARSWQCCCQPHCPRCPRCCCCCCHRRCFEKLSCRSCCVMPTLQCCAVPTLSCPDCSCCCMWSCPKCTKVCSCPKCSGNCCLPCYNCLSNCICC